jgi:hypothetical protein
MTVPQLSRPGGLSALPDSDLVKEGRK